MARPRPNSPESVTTPRPVTSMVPTEAVQFYRDAMRALREHGVPFLVGGAFAMTEYTGIARHTNDFDLFVLPEDRDRAIATLGAVGDCTELTWPHWLAKAYREGHYVDIIYNSSNGIAPVDEKWFDRAVSATVMGIPVKLVPVEEILWQKAFIMDRERYDGADVAHLLRARSSFIDWQHLLDRFGEEWRVLYSHLVLFGFIYPDLRKSVPAWVVERFSARLSGHRHEPVPTTKVCRGTLLTRWQFLVDVLEWGYRDARMWPRQLMSIVDLARWTGGIAEVGEEPRMKCP